MGNEASVAAGQADGAAGTATEAPGPDLVRREILIPGGHGAAFAARAGQLVEIVDLEGQQVADFVAFAERNRTEWLSATHTRSALLRLTAVVGDRLESNWRRPMFEIVRDDVGRNDIITSKPATIPPPRCGSQCCGHGAPTSARATWSPTYSETSLRTVSCRRARRFGSGTSPNSLT
jgi:hypothetical protein